MRKEPLTFTVEDFRAVLGGTPGNVEISALADAYPSYRIRNWRMTLLDGLKKGKSNEEILADKLKAKEIDPVSDQSMGGHARMIDFKLRRAAMRILYLRHRSSGKTRRQANAQVRNAFPNVSRSTVRKNTQRR